jgi:outer membrane immunogenic protein
MILDSHLVPLLGTALSLIMVAGASAADLPPYAPPVPVYQAPAWGWTGCYIGGNIGGGWAKNEVTDVDPSNPTSFDTGADAGSGVVGGVQLGCDLQAGAWVFGVQTMFDGTGIQGSHPYVGGFSNSAFETLGTSTPWFGTLTGRIGYAVVPQALLYAKGGMAWVHNRYTDVDTSATGFAGSLDATQLGWTVGGGVEYSFLPNWSLFAEYAYYDFGNFNATLNYGGGPPYTYNEKQTMQTIMLGVNLRFGPRY